MPRNNLSSPKLLSIVTGCYNEEDNVAELCQRVREVMAAKLPSYDYELIFIDNASTDGTVAVLRQVARQDKRIKIIVNNRNFGHIRSGYYGLLQARGDVVVAMASDLQDPPELIPDFVRYWEGGSKVVLAQKTESREFPLFHLLRTTYYKIVTRLSEIRLLEHVTGFGLYDRRVIEDVRTIDDPYPYLRGLVCDLGYAITLVPFQQPTRKRGITKNNLYTLYDLAMLGITNHSKVPLRLATLAGFVLSALSLVVAIVYLVYKLIFWQRFQAGTAPLVIGFFFLGAVQLFFVGILGEYIGAIHTQVLHRPPVIEKERINFD